MTTPSTAPAGVPVGLATKLGAVAAAVGVLAAGVAAVLAGDHTEETLAGLAFAALNLYAVIRGRMEQAAAAAAAPVLAAPMRLGELELEDELDDIDDNPLVWQAEDEAEYDPTRNHAAGNPGEDPTATLPPGVELDEDVGVGLDDEEAR